MTNTISKPTWLYKTINVPNIDQIKKECMDVFYKHYPNVFGDRGFTFTYADQDILRAEAPAYTEYLKSLGLYDRWAKSVFIGTCGDQRIKDSPIHVDSEDWQTRCYALNIPLINCEHSHTVWYDVKEYDEDAYSGDDQTAKGYKTARGFKPETSTEIDRLATINPAWVNVSVPHRAENSNSDLRLIISTRFWPEVHDYFSN
jgi:hypothetical protein